MKTGSWTFLCVSILSLTPWTTGRQLCPNEVDLRPCTCFSNSDGEATVDCSDVATSGEIWSVFNKAPWPSSRLQLFFLSLNTKLKDLPDGAFGNISFASMYLTLTNLETIAPSALLPSRDRLAHLAIVHSSLEEFPFELLPRMPRLQILHLSHNLLTSVPPLQSQSLQELNLLNNHILKVEETGWATPNLKVLDIGKNPLSRFPSGILNGLEKLEEFSCSECHLGPTLSRGLLDFRSRALRVVHLDGNNISRLEPGAITGLQPNTSVYLRGMENLALSEDSFRPMLEVLTQGDGVLILGRKLFGCDCDVAWLVADRTFLRSIDGGCSSGTELKDLESDSMKNCPRPCPYWCVSRKFMSLCTPGTAILSKVDDCRSNEVCCHLITRESTATTRTTGPSKAECPFGFSCKDVESVTSAHRCNSSFACPSATQACCRIQEKSCPLTHSCIHHSAGGLCEPGTQISNAVCALNRSCCILKTDSQIPPSFSPCNHECVSLTNVHSCVPGTVKFETECRQTGQYCCQVETESRERASGPSPPSNPDPKTERTPCSPTIGFCLSSRHSYCRAENEWELTDLFWCSGDRLCCASKTAVEKRKMELLSNKTGDEEGCKEYPGIQNGQFRILSCPDVPESSLIGEVGDENKTQCVENGKYATGSVVRYTCSQYYFLKGTHTRTCMKNGQWTGQSLPCESECGQRVEPARQGRSAGGSSSYIGEWPWQAAIYDVSREEIICGAALIRENWLLTTASCLNVKGSRISRRPNEFIVYLGKYYRNDSLDDGFVQRRQMSRIILHEDLNLRNLDSDIALVRLTEPAILTWRVQLACLPNQFHPSEENPNDGKFGWVAGWGVDDSDTPSHALADVNIPVISNSKCIQDTIYTTGDLASTGILTSNMFCAGYGIETPLEDYKTVCPGDSGSPMVFYSESSWQVEGIVSHSFSRERCSARRPGQYAVFTKVNRFISWIESKIENTP